MVKCRCFLTGLINYKIKNYINIVRKQRHSQWLPVQGQGQIC